LDRMHKLLQGLKPLGFQARQFGVNTLHNGVGHPGLHLEPCKCDAEETIGY
jgi:hypothetical protein